MEDTTGNNWPIVYARAEVIENFYGPEITDDILVDCDLFCMAGTLLQQKQNYAFRTQF